MFNDKAFYLVNREERHFGFLLFSQILIDTGFRKIFFNLVRKHLGISKTIVHEPFDIYAEIALFRDYWYDLGNPNKYDVHTHKKRQKIIKEILEVFEIDSEIIDLYDMFWTGTTGTSKLRFPGKWPKEEIKKIQIEESIENNKLMRIRWLCNAKPDLLLTAGNFAFFIELKCESTYGKGSDGYDQLQTQEDIILLAKKIVPFFRDFDIEHFSITNNEKDSIGWSDILKCLSEGIVKSHIQYMVGRK